MTEATATVLLEVDETGEYTCTATPRDGGDAAAPVTTKTSLVRDVPGTFTLSGLAAGTFSTT